MKSKTIFLFVFILLCATSAFAKEECFILFDLQSHKVLMQEGNICSDRLSPCSTFKIALSLMGYDAQTLKDTKSPEWQYQSDYEAMFPSWKFPHNPTNWIKDGCI